MRQVCLVGVLSSNFDSDFWLSFFYVNYLSFTEGGFLGLVVPHLLYPSVQECSGWSYLVDLILEGL